MKKWIFGILLAFGLLGGGAWAAEMEYEDILFGDEVFVIAITAEESQWQNMMLNATDKEYIPVDVTIGDQTFENVGIRPKGNSSLSSTTRGGEGRCSFRLEFDKYEKGQTCFGLDVLVLNNMFTDNSMVRDYICFDMMRYLGVDGCLPGFAAITVNGEYWGFYVALEGYESSFCERIFGHDRGHLYSVKNQRLNFDSRDSSSEFGGDGGGSLVYTGDSIYNYLEIFNYPVFGHSGTEDMQRVVEAVRVLDEGQELEQYWDVDQILRYLAVHTFVVNYDSYYAANSQNFFVYEHRGTVSILPWDYNMAFTTSMSQLRDVTALANVPIDEPLSGSTMENRPLFAKLMAVPEYKARYYDYLRQLCEGYCADYEQRAEKLQSRIDGFIHNDPSSLCSYEEYRTAFDALTEFIGLRAESILGQLDGRIPTTAAGQTADSSALVDASHLSSSLSAGSIGGPGGGGGRPAGGMPMPGSREMGASLEASAEASAEISGEMAE